MSSDFPTFSEQGELNVSAYLRRRCEDYVLFGRREPIRERENAEVRG
jgi:hypothetical protein